MTDAIKSVDVAVYTGADDQILRRLTVSAAQDTASKVDAALLLDITFTKVGGQQIETPANARPFTELLQALDAAGLADLGLGGGQRRGRRAGGPRGHREQRRQVRPLHRRCKGDRAKAASAPRSSRADPFPTSPVSPRPLGRSAS